ncbi:26S proteasome subunit RPN7-domain-containing protein [Scleroderma yunnanense]
MEIDLVEEQASLSLPQIQQKRRPARPVDDDHAFDLDAYIASYSGRTAVDRLIVIISTCPSIAQQALQLALAHISRLRDPSLVSLVVSAYESVLSSPAGAAAGLLPVGDVVQVDVSWIDEVTKQNAAERTKLEVELKTYTNNMIKESIRMGHRDLGDFFRSTGEFAYALKHYTKSREFCSTSQHVLDMCLSVLELAIEQRNYAHIPSYVYKAEGALESVAATAAASAAQGNNATAITPTQTQPPPFRGKAATEREQVQTKLDFALALSHLGTGAYDKAATAFLKLDLVAPSDIAIYGILCALGSLSRSTVKSHTLAHTVFATYIEQEPYIRDLVQAYLSSNFKTVLELLARYSTRHYIDIHLSLHVPELTRLIRNVAVVLYFEPFETIRLARMAAAFGWTVDELEREVVGLIQGGRIMGRVDSQNKILVAKKTDHRAELFTHAMKTASQIQSMNRKLLLRMRLQQADLVVKDPKTKREQDRGQGLEAALGEIS